MEFCQYEFQFQNEFMRKLEEEITNLLGVFIHENNIIRIDREEHSFILRKKDSNNFILFSAYQQSYVYLLIVRCDKKYEESLKTILLDICDEIEEDYGEDHRWEIRNVLLESNNRFMELERKYQIIDMFNL